jgi:hypothetical protein
MFWGPLANPENEQLADVGGRELTTLLPLVAFVFVLGFFPGVFLEKMNPSADAFLKNYEAKLLDSNNKDHEPHLYKAALPRTRATEYALGADGSRQETSHD